MGGKGGEARIGYPLTATFLASSRGVWVICQNTANTHTHTGVPLPLLSVSNYHGHQYFRISVRCACVFVCVHACACTWVLSQVFSAATCSPPTSYYSDSLFKGLRTEASEGARGMGGLMSAVPVGRPGTPCQHWHNTWGGLTSCLTLCLHFYFVARLAPPPFMDPRVNKVTFHLFFQVSLLSLPLPLAFPILGLVIIHTSKFTPFPQM